MIETGPIKEGLFTLDAQPKLVGSRCRVCGERAFPKSETCVYCASEDVEDVELADTGVLWSWTAVTAPPPGYRGEVPFGFGVVELDDGLRVITRLVEANPASLSLGQRMKLVLVPLPVPDDPVSDHGEERMTYAFESLGSSPPGERAS